MEERFDQLSKIAVREGGKPMTDTRAEIARAIDTVKGAAAALRTDAGKAIPMGLTPATDNRMAFTRREPIGVVVAVSAFNHPLNLIVHQVAPAVAAGCPFIVKPAPDTPLSCLAFVDILHEAGLPKDWGRAIVTSDNALSEKLATDPRVRVLHLYWIFEGGLGAPVEARPWYPVCAGTRWRGTGNRYRRFRRLRGTGSDPERLLLSCRPSLRVGTANFRSYQDSHPFCDPARHESCRPENRRPDGPRNRSRPPDRPAEVDRVHEWVTEAINGGGQLLTGGEKLSDTIYAPTVIFNAPASCRLMTEEVFGPVVCVDPWFKLEDALDRANSLPTAFQAAVFTRDVERAIEIGDRLDASAVMVNDHTAFRADWMPFAGLRQSGLGTGGVPYTLHDMTIDKMIVLRTDSLVTPTDIEPE